MPSTRAERDALIRDLLHGLHLHHRDAVTAEDAETAYDAWASLLDDTRLIVAHALVEMDAQHTAAGLARAGMVSRQAMHERIARAAAAVDEAAEQYAA
jgi:hypothetical protein